MLECEDGFLKRLNSAFDTSPLANLRADTGIGPTGIFKGFPDDSETHPTSARVGKIDAEHISSGVGAGLNLWTISNRKMGSGRVSHVHFISSGSGPRAASDPGM